MVGGVRVETRAGGAMWEPRTQPARRPTAESREGGAMVEIWQVDPGGRQTEMELMEVEPKSR